MCPYFEICFTTFMPKFWNLFHYLHALILKFVSLSSWPYFEISFTNFLPIFWNLFHYLHDLILKFVSLSSWPYFKICLLVFAVVCEYSLPAIDRFNPILCPFSREFLNQFIPSWEFIAEIPGDIPGIPMGTTAISPLHSRILLPFPITLFFEYHRFRDIFH